MSDKNIIPDLLVSINDPVFMYRLKLVNLLVILNLALFRTGVMRGTHVRLPISRPEFQRDTVGYYSTSHKYGRSLNDSQDIFFMKKAKRA